MELILFFYHIKGIKEMPKIKFPPNENIFNKLSNYLIK